MGKLTVLLFVLVEITVPQARNQATFANSTVSHHNNPHRDIGLGSMHMCP